MKKDITLIFLIVVLPIILNSSCTHHNPNVYNPSESIKLGGEWFLNNQDESFLYYQYNPSEKKHTQEHHHLREMGALWSIARLSNYLNDTRYRELTHRGFKYFEGYFAYDDENDFMYVKISPSDTKIGYSAFIILTLLELDHQKKDYYLDKLANGLIFMQNDDGSLRTFFYSNMSSGVDYYPGESLFALMSLYEHDPDVRYLETVERAFPYYGDYWRKNPNTAFVPWQTRAYKALYDATGRRDVADFIFEMNDYILDKHSFWNKCSNFFFFRGIVTAVYVEGVISAYNLAEELNDTKRMECYANFIEEGLNFIMRLQLTDEDRFGKEALGGFTSIFSKYTRVDRNQHAVTALMEAYELGITGD